jgi:hypothetical protein
MTSTCPTSHLAIRLASQIRDQTSWSLLSNWRKRTILMVRHRTLKSTTTSCTAVATILQKRRLGLNQRQQWTRQLHQATNMREKSILRPFQTWNHDT